jgi:predicted nucleotidyltransferase
MKLTGLITEYNPFHNGHLYHLNESFKLTEATHTVAVMSGHFLQRGEMALFDKWSRATTAVQAGVDLVIELPSIFACSSAEHFARGSILTLNALGCNSFCFGSEEGTLAPIASAAERLLNESPEFKESLQSHLKAGLSYPSARQLALNSENNGHLKFSANNILGVEYLKAILSTKSAIRPYTIQRIIADYSENKLTGHISSATAIRQSLLSPEFDWESIKICLPENTWQTLQTLSESNRLTHQEQAFSFIQYQLLTESIEQLSEYHEFSEGLHHRLLEKALTAKSLDALLNTAKTKRYTRTRIQRGLMNLLLKRKSDALMPLLKSETAPYLRVLAYNQKGREILRHVKKHSDIPLMTNPSRFKAWTPVRTQFFDADVKSTNIFRLIQGSHLVGEDYLRKPEEIG